MKYQAPLLFLLALGATQAMASTEAVTAKPSATDVKASEVTPPAKPAVTKPVPLKADDDAVTPPDVTIDHSPVSSTPTTPAVIDHTAPKPEEVFPEAPVKEEVHPVAVEGKNKSEKSVKPTKAKGKKKGKKFSSKSHKKCTACTPEARKGYDKQNALSELPKVDTCNPCAMPVAEPKVDTCNPCAN